MFDKGDCFGYQQLSVPSTGAVSMTIPVKATEAALVRTNGGTVRLRLDGTAPTTAAGFPIFSTDTSGFWIYGSGPVQNTQMIATTGTQTVDILYFGLRE